MRKISCILLMGLIVVLSSCSGKAATSTVEVDGKQVVVEVHKPRHRAADHQVIVMLGAGYASHPEILDSLVSEYGLAGSGGMVVKFLYPESFKVEKVTKLSLLTEAAKANDVTVLVTVGAPEGTVRELNRLRAARSNLKIITLFPSDDPIAVEAVSDIMIEGTESGNFLAAGTADFVPPEGIDVLLLASVLAAEEKDASIAPLAEVMTSMDTARNLLKKKSAGTGWTFTDYIDPDTNLRSRNRLVLATAAGGSGV